MKTVLVALNSSYTHTNLAVPAISDAAEKKGITCTVVEDNVNAPYERLLYKLVKENADIYGFSCYIWNVGLMSELARDIRRLLPSCKMIFGGPEVSYRAESFINENPYIDYVISGEGEESFPSLCLDISEGKADKRVIYSAPYAGFEESGIYYTRAEGIVYYESSRGCPYSCAYCLSQRAGKLRMKSVQKTLDDLLEFEKYNGIKTIKLVDRTFNADIGRAKEILRGLSSDKYTKNYHVELRALLIDKETEEILAGFEKGKLRVEIGIQSTNRETLGAIGRHGDVYEEIRRCREIVKPGNLTVHLDLIAGLPYEDIKSFGKSFDDLYGIGNELQLGILKILSGCTMERDCNKYGMIYSSRPPYTVLKTAWMNEDDFALLRGIDALNERLSNSGKFAYSFPYLPQKYGSPFEFFTDLYKYICINQCDDVKSISQNRVYELINAFITEKSMGREARDRLAADYILNETRRVPSFLGVEYAGVNAVNGLKITCRMPFISDGAVVFDRENKTITVIKE